MTNFVIDINVATLYEINKNEHFSGNKMWGDNSKETVPDVELMEIYEMQFLSKDQTAVTITHVY